MIERNISGDWRGGRISTEVNDVQSSEDSLYTDPFDK